MDAIIALLRDYFGGEDSQYAGFVEFIIRIMEIVSAL